MNERIKELAEQAGAKFHPAQFCNSPYGGVVSEYWDTYKLDPEKLAELIVKECAKLCDINDAVQDDGRGLGQGSILKEHFGVE